MLERLLGYARGIAARRRHESEADEELAFHLEHEIDANLRRGMPPAEARRVALAALGGLTQTSERIREVRRTPLDTLWRETRHAVRALWATPAFTLVALVVLTLSIGASTTIFSVTFTLPVAATRESAAAVSGTRQLLPCAYFSLH